MKVLIKLGNNRNDTIRVFSLINRVDHDTALKQINQYFNPFLTEDIIIEIIGEVIKF
jgi:hypothetical protein